MKKARPKGKAGRPTFRPTDQDRENVRFLAGLGLREDQICLLVKNPTTGKAIDMKTLRKHFRNELDSAHASLDAKVAQGLYRNATTRTKQYPGGIPLAQIFWLKVRSRWIPAERVKAPPAAPEQPLTPEQVDARETARRMAFLLAAGAAAETGAKKKVKA